MFKSVFAILKKNLYVSFKDNGFLLWLIVVPILWTFLLGIVQENSKNSFINIGVCSLDKSEYGQFLIEALTRESGVKLYTYSDEESLKRAVRSEDIELGLVFPYSLAEDLRAHKSVEIYAFTSLNSSSKLAESKFRKILTRLSIDVQATLAADSLVKELGIPEQNKVKLEKIAFVLSNTYLEEFPSVSVEYLNSSSKQIIPEGFVQTSPGFLSMFLMMDIFFASGYLIFEKEKGLFKRLLTFPISKVSIITGYFLYLFIVGFIQFLILSLFGQFVLSVDYFKNPLITFSFVIYIFCIASLSMVVFTFSRKTSEVSVYGIALSMVLSVLGGSWWPVEIMPPIMKVIARFTPQFYVLDSFNRLYFLNRGLYEVSKNLLVLFLVGIVSLLVSIILLVSKNSAK
ncbi:ABC transporter permease [Caldisericum exile]|uniref:ABC transporter permease protein n=1 Tax=Caldisericum exile (strain DSM 21853 / NBRC 104410 / AZM16c01) TaxID=511051 RepID=A0A7U6GD70_CALEA|nr:ABC transporter permease [Caldisericum exile]BAL80219.1 putative ABC transporter permease protein [Caldisericum exile AZM16c01]